MPDIVAGLVAIGFLVLWIYCIYDVVTTDEVIIRYLPKLVWLLIVLLLADIGSILWLGLGRPRRWTKEVHERRQGNPTSTPKATNVVRDRPSLDDPALDKMNPIVRHREEQARLRMWEAQLARREEELRQREFGFDPGAAE
jgi:hypothetical protein